MLLPALGEDCQTDAITIIYPGFLNRGLHGLTFSIERLFMMDKQINCQVVGCSNSESHFKGEIAQVNISKYPGAISSR